MQSATSLRSIHPLNGDLLQVLGTTPDARRLGPIILPSGDPARLLFSFLYAAAFFSARRFLQKGATTFIIVLIFAAFLILGAATVQAAIPAGERAALLDLYTASNGTSWTFNTGWSTDPTSAGTECSWYGITCSTDADGSNSIIKINLNFNNLIGSLPNALNSLTNLSDFYVSGNQLTGSIPALTGLANLSNFYVSGNQFTGSIPALTGLTNLQNFSADYNQLTGAIPALTGLINLSYFNVNSNQLTGSIPSLTGLTNLQSFDVGYNQLTGSIPTLTGLTNLQIFYAFNNQLTGSIPPLTGLTNLSVFSVTSNQISGSIPVLAGLTHLYDFDVDSNQLTGTIPDLDGLIYLHYFNILNNQIVCSVTYNGNGNTGGNVPIDRNTYAAGATVTVLGNTGNLVDYGYYFAGWNTAANGSGAAYAAGAAFAIGGNNNVALFAQWTSSPAYMLTTVITGSGSISYTYSNGPTISCNGPICSTMFNTGSPLTLTAIPSASSPLFNGWSGAGSASACSGTGTCSFILNSSTIVNAAFTSIQPVMIVGLSDTYYPTITPAYKCLQNLPSGSSVTMEVQSKAFPEQLNFDNSINLVFHGGYDRGFITQSGMTTLQGNLTLNQGSLIADHLIIQPHP